MARKLIGTAVTDENGEATITYTGTGAGKLNIVAESGTFQSKTYEVWDCTKYDLATSDSHNDIWTLGNNGSPKLERKTDYSTLSELISGTDAWITSEINHSCVIEFDAQILTTSYSASFTQCGQSLNALTVLQLGANRFNISDSNWHNCKIEINNGVALCSSDNTSTPISVSFTPTYDSSKTLYFRFRTSDQITEINFKNVKIYPI